MMEPNKTRSKGEEFAVRGIFLLNLVCLRSCFYIRWCWCGIKYFNLYCLGFLCHWCLFFSSPSFSVGSLCRYGYFFSVEVCLVWVCFILALSLFGFVFFVLVF